MIDPASLQRACAGAEVVIAAAHSLLGRGRYNSPKVDDSGHRSLIDAAREAGARHFVYTSAQGAAPDHPVDFYRLKYGVEQCLRPLKVLGKVIRPLHPGVSNLLRMNAYFDAVDLSYYPTENQLDFPKTTLEEFVRERVGARRAEQAG